MQSCREEIVLQAGISDKILVVDGMITNEPGPYTIKLSISSNVNNPGFIPFTGCEITIFDNKKSSEVLTESEPGIYQTSIEGITGIVGNQYRISIQSPEGKRYETEFEEMKELVEIDTIYTELIRKEVFGFYYGLPGYQFYMDTKTATGYDNYYLWKMDETYQYTAKYRLISVYNTELTYADYINLYRCWKTERVKYFFTGKTANLLSPVITKQPLHFVGTETRRLQERYSLLLKQYSITQNAYYFWKNVEALNAEENFLFTTQPYNIIGNIKNKENPDEIIYGYFTVASVSQKRIFVDRPRTAFYYSESCGVNYNIEDLIISARPLFIVGADLGPAAVSEWCIDCTSDGGEPVVPDFWIF